MMNQLKKQTEKTSIQLVGLFLFAFLFQGLIMHAQDLAKSEGVFVFEIETIDYGTIEQNTDGTREFIFTNRGRSPIIMANVKSSCGCTIPKYSKKTCDAWRNFYY
tara:strand:- start:13968 stop:14282 length:315 start_codon:yes stop_codon:yes gene_type:complete